MSRAAEQLVGLPDDAKLPGSSVLFSSQKLTTKTISRKRETIDVIGSGNLSIENEEEEEDDVYLLAKSYFDMKEYRRAAHVLNGVLGKKALFLRCYATYLVSVFNKLFFTCHKGLLYKQSPLCVTVGHIYERE